MKKWIIFIAVAAIILGGALAAYITRPETSGDFDPTGPLPVVAFDVFGITVNITTSVIVQWIVMVLMGLLFFALGRNLKIKPEGKKQAAAEYLVGFFTNTVREAMGEKYMKYVPYMATVMCCSLFFSLSGQLGFSPPTADMSVLASWGLITFFLVQRNKVKTGGALAPFKSLLPPIPAMLPLMLPMNIVGEFTNPLTQVFRHFGNILAGTIIMGLLYWALGTFAVFVPAVFSLYFDFFSGAIQAYIFVMLTTAYVTMADCGPDAD